MVSWKDDVYKVRRNAIKHQSRFDAYLTYELLSKGENISVLRNKKTGDWEIYINKEFDTLIYEKLSEVPNEYKTIVKRLMKENLKKYNPKESCGCSFQGEDIWGARCSQMYINHKQESFYCTKKKGHSGKHVACRVLQSGERVHNIAKWS